MTQRGDNPFSSALAEAFGRVRKFGEIQLQFHAAFGFRAFKPVYDVAPFSVCGRPEADGRIVRLWARDSENHLAMDMQVSLA